MMNRIIHRVDFILLKLRKQTLDELAQYRSIEASTIKYGDNVPHV
ncbi:unnamed protein product, partial [Rotaria sp. Silwood2]